MDPETRFRGLFELAYPALCRYARHRGLTGADADDLVAQTFEVAWRRIGDVPADDPMPWLYAVARNLWREHHRQRRRRSDLLPGSACTQPRVRSPCHSNQAPCAKHLPRCGRVTRRSCG